VAEIATEPSVVLRSVTSSGLGFVELRGQQAQQSRSVKNRRVVGQKPPVGHDSELNIGNPIAVQVVVSSAVNPGVNGASENAGIPCSWRRHAGMTLFFAGDGLPFHFFQQLVHLQVTRGPRTGVRCDLKSTSQLERKFVTL
jgi:hypothetical protein